MLGETGLGKSTLLRSLFLNNDLYEGRSVPPAEGIHRSHLCHNHAVIAIVVRATAACPIQTNFLRQTLFQHCSTICLELSPCLCSELWHAYIN